MVGTLRKVERRPGENISATVVPWKVCDRTAEAAKLYASRVSSVVVEACEGTELASECFHTLCKGAALRHWVKDTEGHTYWAKELF